MVVLEVVVKVEGMLIIIVLLYDWCGYGEVIVGFKVKYFEIIVNELNFDVGLVDEFEVICVNKDNKGLQVFDVIDVGLFFGLQVKVEGLIQFYKVVIWDIILEDVKDVEGFWYGDYYGVMVFGVNIDLIDEVLKLWKDFSKLEYVNVFVLVGDLCVLVQVIIFVMVVGLVNGGEVGEVLGQKGMELLVEVNKVGNFVLVIGKLVIIVQGVMFIVIVWDYNLLFWCDGLNGNLLIEVIIFEDGVVVGVYVQVILVYVLYLNVVKLWMEYLYLDEGQFGWLKGYCYLICFNDLVVNGKVL